MRVKWADHFGGALEDSRLIEGENIVPTAQGAVAESWSDRKKRDREKEKKLLLTMKYVLDFCSHISSLFDIVLLAYSYSSTEKQSYSTTMLSPPIPLLQG